MVARAVWTRGWAAAWANETYSFAVEYAVAAPDWICEVTPGPPVPVLSELVVVVVVGLVCPGR
jgi:hypothetical protein